MQKNDNRLLPHLGVPRHHILVPKEQQLVKQFLTWCSVSIRRAPVTWTETSLYEARLTEHWMGTVRVLERFYEETQHGESHAEVKRRDKGGAVFTKRVYRDRSSGAARLWATC